MRTQFFDTFWNDTKYVNGYQTSYILALYNELYPNQTIESLLKQNLLRQIKDDGNKVSTGIIGTKFIFPLLSEMNQTDLALFLIKGGNDSMNATYPSYRFMFNNSIEPALTTWELWNTPLTTGDIPDNLPHMDSRNQQMFTTVSAYLNQYISGLIQGHKYNHFILNIGHLNKDTLQWSNIKKNDGLQYYWKWENRTYLDVNITIPVGYNIETRLKFKDNQQCQWTIYNTNKGSVDLKMDKVLGSGRYNYQFVCK